jgi:hypothetical protein
MPYLWFYAEIRGDCHTKALDYVISPDTIDHPLSLAALGGIVSV